MFALCIYPSLNTCRCNMFDDGRQAIRREPAQRSIDWRQRKNWLRPNSSQPNQSQITRWLKTLQTKKKTSLISSIYEFWVKETECSSFLVPPVFKLTLQSRWELPDGCTKPGFTFAIIICYPGIVTNWVVTTVLTYQFSMLASFPWQLISGDWRVGCKFCIFMRI